VLVPNAVLRQDVTNFGLLPLTINSISVLLPRSAENWTGPSPLNILFRRKQPSCRPGTVCTGAVSQREARCAALTLGLQAR